jgi:hypothetical protein
LSFDIHLTEGGTKMNPYIKAGLVALAAYAAVALVQRKVVKIPVIGGYLPG